MPIDYAGLAAGSLEAIREAGTKVVHKRYSEAYDTVTQVNTRTLSQSGELDAVILPAKKANAMAGFKQGFDDAYVEKLRAGKVRALLCAASSAAFPPEPGDEVEFSGATWEVLGCTPIDPTGAAAVIYKVEVARK